MLNRRSCLNLHFRTAAVYAPNFPARNLSEKTQTMNLMKLMKNCHLLQFFVLPFACAFWQLVCSMPLPLLKACLPEISWELASCWFCVFCAIRWRHRGLGPASESFVYALLTRMFAYILSKKILDRMTPHVIDFTRHRSGQLVVGGWSSPARPWSIQFTTEAGHRFLWRGGGQKISSLTWPMWPNCLAALLRHQETSRC